MVLRIISDIHIESYRRELRFFLDNLFDDYMETDVLVLAGDICENKNQEEIDLVLSYINKYPKVISVKGNHDCYNGVGMIQDSQLASTKGVEVYNNVNFIYATLWTDVSKISDKGFKGLIDNIKIEGFSKESVLRENKIHKDFIFNNLSENKKNIVVTHFTPSYKSCAPKYKKEPYNDYFHNRFDKLIEDSKIDLWIHGHTHTFMDYKIGNTRVFCNPVGRPSEKNNSRFKSYIEI